MLSWFFFKCCVQTNYKPDGWLGLLLGAKIFIDFAKSSFDDAMDKLKNEIKLQLNLKSGGVSDAKPKSLKENNKQNSINLKISNEWDKSTVSRWLTENSIDESIIDELRDFDGKMLEELNLIRNTAPEYFFAAISNNNKHKLHEVIKFSKELRKLV
jgi:hypothetical protein